MLRVLLLGLSISGDSPFFVGRVTEKTQVTKEKIVSTVVRNLVLVSGSDRFHGGCIHRHHPPEPTRTH